MPKLPKILSDILPPFPGSAFPIYIPSNRYGIQEGRYGRNELVNLLRQHKANAAATQFLADMLEA